MPAMVDAELTLRPGGDAYQAELFVNSGRDQSRSDNSRRYGPFAVPLDLVRLREKAGDPAAYGQALAEMLFDAVKLREELAAARARADALGGPLRLRLWLAPGAEDLHGLAWELLTLPGQAEPLCTREDILFSRYLPAGADAPPPRPKGRLRALVAIASPWGLRGSGLAPIDRSGWQAHARTGLVGMEIEWLPPLPAERGAPAAQPEQRCTLARLVERIPGQDVLLLVCHGMLSGGEGQLLLETEQGKPAPVKAAALERRLGGTLRLPRLAILVVCDSAGSGGGGETAGGGTAIGGDETAGETAGGGDKPAGDHNPSGGRVDGRQALAAIGPRLVALGIPAVLAMHGSLSFETADLFFPALFRALQEDGAIDRAVARARRAIVDQPDERAPVLMMSLNSGRLWSEEAQPEPPVREPPAAKPSADRRPETGQIDQRVLYAALNGPAFTLSDLEELCFELGIDWDNIRGDTKSEKARALIRYCVSRSQYDGLLAAVRQARPGLL